MRYLNWVDYGVFAIYFTVLIAVGFYLKKRASASMADYFLGGRRMPWWLLGISGMAAWVDMTGTMIITSFLFMMGPRGLFVEFRGGAGLVLVFLLLWLGKWHRRSGCLTGAEWMTFRFGSGFGGNFAKLAVTLAAGIFSAGILTYSMVGAGLFFSMFFPFPPWVCTAILLGVTLVYVASSGFYGVVVADMFQMAIVISAAIGITIMAISRAASGESLAVVAERVTANTDWMSSWPSRRTTMPVGYEAYSGLLAITGFYLVKTIIQGLGVGGEPKYFGARSDRECGLLSFLTGWLMSIRWFLMISFVVLGLYLIDDLFSDTSYLSEAAALIRSQVGDVGHARWSHLISGIMNHPHRYPMELTDGLSGLLGGNWTEKLSLLSYNGTVDSERILPAVLLFYFPAGVRGLLLVAMTAAAMSTFNIFINSTAAMFTNDIYRNYFRPNASTRELLYFSYAFGVVLVGGSFFMAYFVRNINDIWGWLSMGLAGGLIIPMLLRLYWWRFNGVGFAVGICVGLIAALMQRFFWPAAAETSQFVVITAISLAASIIGTYATPPTDRKVVEKFYLKTRPFGFWKPFESLLGEKGLVLTRREHFYDLLAVPFTFLWQVMILLAPMQIVIGAYKGLWVTIPLLVIGLAGMYQFWYKKMPAENVEIPLPYQSASLLNKGKTLEEIEKSCR